METIRDIKREEGNPHAGRPNSGPMPVNRTFRSPGAGMQLIATAVMILGVILGAIGVVTFIIPITFVGLEVMGGSAILFARANSSSNNT